jgi:hypothetical protein
LHPALPDRLAQDGFAISSINAEDAACLIDHLQSLDIGEELPVNFSEFGRKFPSALFRSQGAKT